MPCQDLLFTNWHNDGVHSKEVNLVCPTFDSIVSAHSRANRPPKVMTKREEILVHQCHAFWDIMAEQTRLRIDLARDLRRLVNQSLIKERIEDVRPLCKLRVTFLEPFIDISSILTKRRRRYQYWILGRCSMINYCLKKRACEHTSDQTR